MSGEVQRRVDIQRGLLEQGVPQHKARGHAAVATFPALAYKQQPADGATVMQLTQPPRDVLQPALKLFVVYSQLHFIRLKADVVPIILWVMKRPAIQWDHRRCGAATSSLELPPAEKVQVSNCRGAARRCHRAIAQSRSDQLGPCQPSACGNCLALEVNLR